jgi:hypothetical protein
MDEEPNPDDYAPTLDEIIRKALVEGKSIFCENEAVSDFIKLTIPDLSMFLRRNRFYNI